MKKIIFTVLSLLVVAMFLVGCAEKELTKEEEQALEAELEQLSDEELDQVIEEGESEDTKALAGQAYKKVSVGRYNYKPSRVVKSAYKIKAQRFQQKQFVPRVDLTKYFSDLATCKCTTPSHVNIKCNNWNNTVIFDNFKYEETGDLQSSQNAYGAFCVRSKNMVPETSFMQCDSFFNDENCDNFCESQLIGAEIAEIENDLNDCVSYFTNQCNGAVTVEGAYGDQAHTVNGEWWTVYGLCGEPEEMFGE